MKIIFSRKGFDSTAGGAASLIFPDGTLFSIPIPSSEDDNFYSGLSFQYEGHPIQTILNDVLGMRIKNNHKIIDCNFTQEQQRCHHDPMWMPHANRLVLGQAAIAESHLQNQNVGTGDIFVFYGWFRKIEKIDGRWRYSPSSRDVQLIWSWMKIGDALDVGTQSKREQSKRDHSFLHLHPHMADSPDSPYPGTNRVYISEKGGLLAYSNPRCLTDCINYRGRSTWRLPRVFNQPQAFTFLKDFSLEGDDVIITYRGYGQEFVLDLEKVSPQNDREGILRYLYEYVLSSELNEVA